MPGQPLVRGPSLLRRPVTGAPDAEVCVEENQVWCGRLKFGFGCGSVLVRLGVEVGAHRLADAGASGGPSVRLTVLGLSLFYIIS